MNKENSIQLVDEEKNIEKYEIEDIKQKIYTIRGKQVMLDSDVARLYKYSTKNINKAMNRNKERFPEDFCFRLSEGEVLNLRFQIGTSSLEKDNYGGRRYLPYVYTEQGIAMLSGILKNDIAIEMSIKIIRAFIEMRNFLINNGQIFNRLTNVEFKLIEHDKKFEEVFNQFQIKDNVKYIYHIGASIKDLGKKCFGIILIKYNAIIEDILSKISII